MDVIRHDSMLPASDIPEAIQWHEGMLLAPQHFQQLAWRQDALLHYVTLATAPFAWGVRHVRIDPVLLVSGLLRVVELEAILPDGLLVTHTPQAPEALEVDLAPYAEALHQQELPVHLAVPARTRGVPSAQGDLARYVSVEGAAMTDENTGEGDLRIPRLRPRLSLLLTATPPAQYVYLPLARVCYQHEGFALTDFLPPTWTVPLHSPLGEVCTRMARRLREKAVALAEKARAPSATLGTPMLLEAQKTVHHLVAALPPLEAIVYSGVAHPYVVYLALCTVAGQAAALGNSLLPPVFESYNHHDLRASFAPLEAFIMRMLDEGMPEVYAAPLAAWLTPRATQLDRTTTRLLTKWNGILTQLDAYDTKKPGNSVAILERFVLQDTTDLAMANCQPTLTPQDLNSAPKDFFLERRNTLRSALFSRCQTLAATTALTTYTALTTLFNTRLAGQFPFAERVDDPAGVEAEPEAIRAFYRLFDQSVPMAQTALRSTVVPDAAGAQDPGVSPGDGGGAGLLCPVAGRQRAAHPAECRFCRRFPRQSGQRAGREPDYRLDAGGGRADLSPHRQSTAGALALWRPSAPHAALGQGRAHAAEPRGHTAWRHGHQPDRGVRLC